MTMIDDDNNKDDNNSANVAQERATSPLDMPSGGFFRGRPRFCQLTLELRWTGSSSQSSTS